MSKNHLINSDFWRDPYTSNLDPVEKLLFLYLISNPDSNIAGAYQLPIKIIAVDTGVDKDMILKIAERFLRDDKIFIYDGWVAIKNRAKFNKLDNPNIQKGIIDIINKSPEFIREFLNNTSLLKPLKVFTKGHIDIDKNKNKDKDINNKDLVFNAWNEKIGKFDWASKCEALTDKRKVAIKERMADKYWVENWELALDLIPFDPFYRGEVGREGEHKHWKPNIDWFLRPNTVIRIIEKSKEKEVETPAEKWVKENDGKLRGMLAPGIDIFCYNAEWLWKVYKTSEGASDFAEKIKYYGAKNLKRGV